MRKVWLAIFIVLALVMTSVLPAYAYTATYYKWVWNGQALQVKKISKPAAQPAVPSVPRTPKPEPSPAGGNTPVPTAPSQSLTADESYILERVNAERAKAGLAPLKIDYRLVQTARAKSKDMIDNHYFAHQSPVLGSPFDQMRKAGISYRYAGENIAGNSSAASAMTSWMNSPGHRANILNPNFTHIGIGVVNGGPYGKMLTQHFIGI